MNSALRRWEELQAARRIPREILSVAARTPWRMDVDYFRPPRVPPDTPSREAAWALLSEGCDRCGGIVVDVGCGAGAASLAVAARTSFVIGIDERPEMIDAFAQAAGERGVAYVGIRGSWPAVAAHLGGVDVAICHNVAFHLKNPEPFVAGLIAVARRGVVMEMAAEHPLAWLDPLWLQFHGVRMGRAPVAEDFVDVLKSAGMSPTVARWSREPKRSATDAEWVTQRLCLDPDRVGDVERALALLPSRSSARVTLTW